MIGQLDEEVTIGLNEKGIYTVYLHSDPFVRGKDDLIPFNSFALPIPIIDSVVSLPLPDLAELSLDKGILKGDQLIFTLNSVENTDVSVKISLPQFTKNGDVFEVEYIIPFDGASPGTLMAEPIDLNGYTVDFSNGDLTLRYEAWNEAGQRIILPLSFAQITGFEFSYLEGSIVRTSISTDLQRIDIDIQDSLIAGEYQFQDPKIHFDLNNSFGIPLGVKVKEVFILGNDSIQQPLESSLFDQIIILDYPGFDQQGEVVRDRITFDKENSNLLELTHNDIIGIDYNLDIILNPQEISDERFFILDTSRALVTAEVELSFEALVDNVSISKIVDLDFSRLDSIDFLRLKVVVENGLPLSFQPDLTLMDTISGARIELNEENGVLISNANVNDSGDVLSTTSSLLFYSLDIDQLSRVKEMNQLEAEFNLRSPGQGTASAKIKPGQKLMMRVGAEAKFR